MSLTTAVQVPRATYRVQLTPTFTFADLEKQLPYLRALGISDLYLSPIFTAVPGSTHGYDVCDYTSINEELGGREGFNRLCARARDAKLGIILDFVPNHMGISGPRNRWWLDVLEFGRYSPYSDFFDIQWYKGTQDGQPRVLLPMLGHQYGRELAEGNLTITHGDRFELAYFDHRIPLNPGSSARILGPLLGAEAPGPWSALVDEFRAPPPPPAAEGNDESARQWTAKIARALARLADLLRADAGWRRRLEARLAEINRPPFAELAAIIDDQHYRPARWKTGVHEINYRRFFVINSLIGLHMEEPKVFAAAHALLRELIRDPAITGLRIDHVDGLRAPATYLRRLQDLATAERGAPLYLAVEKILEARESPPADWPVHGTTGYEFIPQLAGVLVQPDAAAAFTATYQRFTGELRSYPHEVARKKEFVMDELFADVMDALASDLAAILADDLRWRDFTRHELAVALVKFLSQLGVYRTYAGDGAAISAIDQRVIEEACAKAIALNPLSDPQPLEFLRDLQLGLYPPAAAPAALRERVREWMLTWQQYTGAVMAKSVEDTAYYTYCRFIGLNEVGGDPAAFGGSVAAFHEQNQQRAREAPLTLLTTSTHDTKLSEDVRARLYALSELAPEWEMWVTRWRTLAAPHVARLAGEEAPDALDQYRLFQVLLGAWPLEPEQVDDTFRGRLRDHFRKAVREAKRHSSDLNPNEAYLAACDRYLEGLTGAESGRDFLAEFVPAAQRIARLGFVNALAQVILKATVPGVPDFYQGEECWDFSLVDPDNRRPVDYARRRALLARSAQATPTEQLANWQDGGIKLWVTQVLLDLRSQQPGLLAHGSYAPVTFRGIFQDNLVGFERRAGARGLVVLVPRLTAAIGSPPVGAVWHDTQAALPSAATGWRDVFTQHTFVGGTETFVRDLFSVLPFCVLTTEI